MRFGLAAPFWSASEVGRETNIRSALWLTSLTGLLGPVAGVISAPILARALSVDGRGELAAALAPVSFVVAVATFGLPDALTHHLARNPSWRRRALLLASVISGLAGLICLSAVYLLRVPLSGGHERLAELMMIGAALAIPTLIVGVLRGAATGLQQWSLLSLERVLSIILRVSMLVGLWITDTLTVLTAILVTMLVPVATGLLYLRIVRGMSGHVDAASDDPRWPLRPLMGFGSRVWLGSIANMVLAQSAQLLMVPLSSARELGLYSVATTIADVPLVVAMSIQAAILSLQSQSPSVDQVAKVSRYTFALTAVGCVAMACSLPLWLGPLFGQEFVGAAPATLLLLLCSVLSVPGAIAAAALAGWGRPALRTMAVVVTLVVFAGLLLLLIPVAGATGAAWASVVSTALLSSVLLLIVRHLSGVKIARFFPLRRSDLRELLSEGDRARHAVARRLRARSS